MAAAIIAGNSRECDAEMIGRDLGAMELLVELLHSDNSNTLRIAVHALERLCRKGGEANIGLVRAHEEAAPLLAVFAEHGKGDVPALARNILEHCGHEEEAWPEMRAKGLLLSNKSFSAAITGLTADRASSDATEMMLSLAKLDVHVQDRNIALVFVESDWLDHLVAVLKDDVFQTRVAATRTLHILCNAGPNAVGKIRQWQSRILPVAAKLLQEAAGANLSGRPSTDVASVVAGSTEPQPHGATDYDAIAVTAGLLAKLCEECLVAKKFVAAHGLIELAGLVLQNCAGINQGAFEAATRLSAVLVSCSQALRCIEASVCVSTPDVAERGHLSSANKKADVLDKSMDEMVRAHSACPYRVGRSNLAARAACMCASRACFTTRF